MGVSAGVGLWILGVTGVFPDGQRYALFFGAFYGLMELVPVPRAGAGGAPADPRRAVQRSADRGLGGAAVRRAPAARGPRRRAAGLRPLAADQPPAGHLRAAGRGRALRDHRRLHRAAARRRRARDRRLPAPPPRARAVGDDEPRRGGRGRRPTGRCDSRRPLRCRVRRRAPAATRSAGRAARRYRRRPLATG